MTILSAKNHQQLICFGKAVLEYHRDPVSWDKG